MNLLLDTCALLALASGSLTERAGNAVRSAPEALLSPVVPWELAIKVKSGRLRLPMAPLAYVETLAARHQLSLPPGGLDAALLCAAADLPLVHRDPFDRILVATAHRDGLAIVTSDRVIPNYPGVHVVW